MNKKLTSLTPLKGKLWIDTMYFISMNNDVRALLRSYGAPKKSGLVIDDTIKDFFQHSVREDINNE